MENGKSGVLVSMLSRSIRIYKNEALELPFIAQGLTVYFMYKTIISVFFIAF